MSKHETAMTRVSWRKIGGALCEEYPLVKSGKANGWRKVDGLIVLGEPTKRAPCSAYPDLKGRDIVLLQTKAHRLGMYVLGQALFSRELALRLGVKSARTTAVVKETDAVLEPLAKKYGIEVQVIKAAAPRSRTRETDDSDRSSTRFEASRRSHRSRAERKGGSKGTHSLS